MPGVSSERESEFTPVRAHAARGGHRRRMGSRPTQVTEPLVRRGVRVVIAGSNPENL